MMVMQLQVIYLGGMGSWFEASVMKRTGGGAALRASTLEKVMKLDHSFLGSSSSRSHLPTDVTASACLAGILPRSRPSSHRCPGTHGGLSVWTSLVLPAKQGDGRVC